MIIKDNEVPIDEQIHEQFDEPIDHPIEEPIQEEDMAEVDPPAPPASVPASFRNPGEFDAVGVQFFEWRSERDHWKSGTKPLERKFDLNQRNLMTFLNRVKERAKAFNWTQ
jgi:hypothetical protein